MAPMKLIWLSDLHFVADGTVQGHDPVERVSRAVDFINRHHPDAAYCVISGDLVDRATERDYAAVASHLDRLAVPCLPMVGNHDDRALLRRAMPLPETVMDDFIQYAVRTDAAHLICLDTLTPGADHGSFCQARLDWLAQRLSAAPETPAIVFMHHPPMALGLPMQDADRLKDGAALLDLLALHPQVRQLCIGHVHRPITGSVRGIPFATLPAVLYQAPPPVPAWTWDSFAPAAEAPALGVLTLQGGEVQIHNVQFCAYADGVTSAVQ